MLSFTVFCVLLVSVSCFPFQGAMPAAPKVSHADALKRHAMALQQHANPNKWNGPMAGGDLFWANPAAKAWYPQQQQVPAQQTVQAPVQTPVQAQPQPAAAPVLTHAQALQKHHNALLNHNVNDLFWALAPPAPTQGQAQATPAITIPPAQREAMEAQRYAYSLAKHAEAVRNHNTNDLFWALPAGMRPQTAYMG